MANARAVKCPPAGSPAWVVTFADLMSLLMCFFVLLLSFSEMDIQKYKQIAGSMRMAFGVQRDVEVKAIPKGTSVVMQEFSPGRPEPSPVQELRQQTSDENQEFLATAPEQAEPSPPAPEPVAEEDELAERLREALEEEIQQGLLDVERKDGKTIIRIQEKGSFPSGSADLIRPFLPVMERIATVLAETPGRVVVAGHTDNIPIATARFRSNWELSAARAVTVVHELFKYQALDREQERFVVEGRGDAAALVPNDTPEGRARNRRVEIIIEES